MPIDTNEAHQPAHQQEAHREAKAALDAWLEGQSVDESMKLRWLDDEKLAPIYQAACMMEQKIDDVSEVEVPNWDAQSTFVSHGPTWQQKVSAWFNPSPRLSMAFSIAAVFMVLFKVEVQFDDGGVKVAFANQNQASIEAELTKQFEQRLVQYDREQQILIANYFDDIQSQQQQDVTQLASYLITASRQERKEDMGALVSYFNEQRSEDINVNQQQLSKLMLQLQQQNTSNPIRRASLQSFESVKDTNSTLSNQKEQ